jgi:transposase
MPRPRIAMRKIRELLRLVIGQGLSRRRAAAAIGIPYTTAADCLTRAAAAGLDWPLPQELSDAELEARLYRRDAPPPASQRPQPDWNEIHRELRRKGVTLQLLWIEFTESHPDGYRYTQFVRHYRQGESRLDVVMRQEHRAGEKVFLDFAGPTIPITDPETGVVWQAQLFVAVLGASNYTYVEVLPSQELPYWIAAHVHLFEFLGGVPEILVPDYVARHIIRRDRLRHAPQILEAAHMGAQPRRKFLAGARLHVQQPAGSQSRHEYLGSVSLSGPRIDEGQGVAAVVDEQPLPTPVLQPHHHVLGPQPAPVVQAELAVRPAVRVVRSKLNPKQFERHVSPPLQLPVDLPPVRH